MSFLASAVSSTGNFWRSVLLIAFIFAFIFTFFYICIFFLVPRIMEGIAPAIQDISMEGGNSLKFSLRGKSVSVVNVPAYQLWTPSGVKLRKNANIQIRASGIVSTGTSSFDLFNSLKLSEEDIFKWKFDEIDRRILNIELDRDIHLGWRKANGERINGFALDIESGENCIVKQSLELKLDKGSEYGSLLVFFINPEREGESINDLLANRKVQTFRIGTNARINYDKNREIFLLSSEEQEDKQIPKIYENSSLYITVNDIVIRSKSDLEIPGYCKDDEVSPSIKANRAMQIKIYEKMSNPHNIWYLNNRGSFLVSIEQS